MGLTARVLLAVVSAAAVAVGAGLAWLPAGLIVGGAEGLAAVYVWTYLAARTSGEGRRAR